MKKVILCDGCKCYFNSSYTDEQIKKSCADRELEVKEIMEASEEELLELNQLLSKPENKNKRKHSV